MRKHYTTAQRAELTSLVAFGQATLRAAAARMGVPESTCQEAGVVAANGRPAIPRRDQQPPPPPKKAKGK